MAELTQSERLQPSLLDRLKYDAPNVLTIHQLRKSVERDLEWLLNTINLEAVLDLGKYENTRNSVINYGIPDLAGKTASGIEIRYIEKMLRQAILDFEPRLLKNTVKVSISLSNDELNINAMRFDIEGELWALPVPLKLFLRTEIELESGSAKVEDITGSS